MQLKETFLQLRKEYIAARFKKLNKEQREAVLQTEGPLLILAGAGSGKTTVLVNRTRCILEYGSAYTSDEVCREVTEGDIAALRRAMETEEVSEDLRPLLKAGNVQPWNILAITFTNKAAAQLKERICAMTGNAGQEVFASTFHSACVRFLRRDADRIGFAKNFTIYDTDDSQRVLKELYKELGVDDRMFPLRAMQGTIGRLKDSMQSPEEFMKTAGDFRNQTVGKVYAAYQRRLMQAGAMDFDDLIYHTVRLLEQDEEVREYYHKRFRYIMVDEYQDTSHAQYRLVRLLTGPHSNICVVGDDDQSIYRFRGATIENILSFEESFTGAKVIRLEQNYRSTENILEAANAVIAHNAGRKGKTLWSDAGAGDRITVYCADTEHEEAAFIAREVLLNRERGISLSQQAVLYRMNAQSNAIESYFARAGIPYRVYGGLKFFDRAEIKDILSYMHIVANPRDDLRLTRIINKPARKIGDATVAAIADIAAGLGVPMLEVVCNAGGYPALSRAKTALDGFAQLYRMLCDRLETAETLGDFAEDVLELTGYTAMLKAQGDEGLTRLENVRELVSSIRTYEADKPDAELSDYLEEIALVTTMDNYDEDAETVTLMTLHSAKGLEFDCVYIAGLEEGIFPGDGARFNGEEIEEERRLAYVGITRARKKLYLTRAFMRMLFGSTRRNQASRFLSEFSDELKDDRTPKRASSFEQRSFGGEFGEGGGSRYGGDYATSRGGSSSVGLGSRSTVTLGSSRSIGAAAAKPAAKATGATFAAGDVVEHKVFGRGRVLSATPLGGDTLVEVEFEKHGRKKAMANYAPMKKAEE